jgi:hypothetical protein
MKASLPLNIPCSGENINKIPRSSQGERIKIIEIHKTTGYAGATWEGYAVTSVIQEV